MLPKLYHFKHFLSVQFNDIKHIHIVVLPLPPTVPAFFSSPQSETLYPLNSSAPFSPPSRMTYNLRNSFYTKHPY